MKILNRPYHRMQIKRYCSGVITKNAQKRMRWSAGCVGVSVMYSRNARKEIKPKRTKDPVSPALMAIRKRIAMIHHARMREFRFSAISRPLLLLVFNCQIRPAIEASDSNRATPVANKAILNSGASEVINVSTGPLLHAREPRRHFWTPPEGDASGLRNSRNKAG